MSIAFRQTTLSRFPCPNWAPNYKASRPIKAFLGLVKTETVLACFGSLSDYKLFALEVVFGCFDQAVDASSTQSKKISELSVIKVRYPLLACTDRDV